MFDDRELSNRSSINECGFEVMLLMSNAMIVVGDEHVEEMRRTERPKSSRKVDSKSGRHLPFSPSFLNSLPLRHGCQSTARWKARPALEKEGASGLTTSQLVDSRHAANASD